jgi:hypothetical protein
MVRFLDLQPGEERMSLPTSNPSTLTVPKGRRPAFAPVPAPKRSQSVVANFVASASLVNADEASAPPRLSMTFLPRPWQAVMSAARFGQEISPVAPAAVMSAVAPPLHAAPKLTVGYPPGPSNVVRKDSMTMSTLESLHNPPRVD